MIRIKIWDAEKSTEEEAVVYDLERLIEIILETFFNTGG